MADTNEQAAEPMAARQVGPNPEQADLSNDPTMYPTGGGLGSTGDLTGPGAEVDTLKQTNGDVPLPAGLDHHAPIPQRGREQDGPAENELTGRGRA